MRGVFRLLRCWRAIFSAPADFLALRNLPFATLHGARFHSFCVLQRVSFIFDVSGFTGRKNDRTHFVDAAQNKRT